MNDEFPHIDDARLMEMIRNMRKCKCPQCNTEAEYLVLMLQKRHKPKRQQVYVEYSPEFKAHGLVDGWQSMEVES